MAKAFSFNGRFYAHKLSIQSREMHTWDGGVEVVFHAECRCGWASDESTEYDEVARDAEAEHLGE